MCGWSRTIAMLILDLVVSWLLRMVRLILLVLDLLFGQAIFRCSDCCFCCCNGLGMLNWLRGCLIFYRNAEMAANIYTSLVIIELLGRASPEYFTGKNVQTLAGSRHRLSLLQKVLEETLPALPSLVDHSMIQCLELCIVDTTILVVLSAGEQNMHVVGSRVLLLQAF